MGSTTRAAAVAVLLGAAYFAAAVGAMTFTGRDGGTAILWLPNGLLLAALLLCPPRLWPVCVLASLVAQVAADLPHFSLSQAVAFWVVNAAECLGAAWLLRRPGGRAPFRLDSLARVLKFVLVGPVLCAALGGIARAVVLQLGSELPGRVFLVDWAVWWLGDATGLLLAAPLVVVWYTQRKFVLAVLRHSPRRPEMAVAFVLSLLAGWLVFVQPWSASPLPQVGGYLMLPVVLWGAIRFGMPGATLASLVAGAFVVAGTAAGTGPFGTLEPVVAVTRAQETVVVLCLTGLVVGAALNEVEGQQHALRLRQRAIEAADEGITIADARADDLPLTYVNEAFLRITGYPRAETLGRNCRFLQGEERDQPALAVLRRAVAEGCPGRALLRNFRRDGTPFWNEVTLSPVRNSRGVLTHFVGLQHDVTELVDAKQSLQAAKAELEARVAERTRELQEANARLAELAGTDPLTGAMNRRMLDQRAEFEIRRAGRTGRPLSLLLLDLDHFKQVNDSLGHAVGDVALVEVTKVMADTVRRIDRVARLGGEEFLVLLPETGREEAVAAAERVRAAVEARQLEHDGAAVRVTVSIGVAAWRPGEPNLRAAITRADRALYRAKEAGRNRVEAQRGAPPAVGASPGA